MLYIQYNHQITPIGGNLVQECGHILLPKLYTKAIVQIIRLGFHTSAVLGIWHRKSNNLMLTNPLSYSYLQKFFRSLMKNIIISVSPKIYSLLSLYVNAITSFAKKLKLIRKIKITLSICDQKILVTGTVFKICFEFSIAIFTPL